MADRSISGDEAPTTPDGARHERRRVPDEHSLSARNPNLLRDRLANERTFLAWLRTGIAVAGLGFVVARFDIFLQELARASGHPNTAAEVAKQGRAVIPLGVVLMLAGAGMVMLAAIAFLNTDQALLRGYPDTRPLVRVIVLALTMLAVIAGVSLALHLLSSWPD